MKENNAAEAAVLLEALALIRKDSGQITEKWAGAASIAVCEIYLPAACWASVLAYARGQVIERLREFGIKVQEEPK